MTATVPLDDQIAEVERELRAREHVYPRLIEKGRLKPETADKHVCHLTWALQSLKFLRANQDWIKSIAAQRRAQAQERAADHDTFDPTSHPAVSAVLEAIPGSQIAGVRVTDGPSP